MKRYLEEHILKDLDDQMVFLGGARQVGKTMLSLNLLGVLPFWKLCQLLKL